MKTRGILNQIIKLVLLVLVPLTFSLCNKKPAAPSKAVISEIKLIRGDIALCGDPGKHFGTVEFETSCSGKVKEEFNLAIAMLHSFEYEEAEKVFAKVIDAEPDCAMAYWGVAMCNYHPLWTPPTGPELQKGAKALEIARSITQKSKRETEYVDAI